MVSTTDLKNGKTFEENGTPYVVVKYFHQKLGRGGATVRLTLRNLKTGDQVEKTYNSTNKFEEITTTKRPLQFLYADSDSAIFMDPTNYNQVEIPLDVASGQLKFIKEGEEVSVLFWEDKALTVEIAPKVILKVTETAPGVKGNSATNIYKPATLENDLQIKVPLFIKVGDKIKVDTRTSEYVERVN